jgi:hypothetical protein
MFDLKDRHGRPQDTLAARGMNTRRLQHFLGSCEDHEHGQVHGYIPEPFKDLALRGGGPFKAPPQCGEPDLLGAGPALHLLIWGLRPANGLHSDQLELKD